MRASGALLFFRLSSQQSCASLKFFQPRAMRQKRTVDENSLDETATNAVHTIISSRKIIIVMTMEIKLFSALYAVFFFSVRYEPALRAYIQMNIQNNKFLWKRPCKRKSTTLDITWTATNKSEHIISNTTVYIMYTRVVVSSSSAHWIAVHDSNIKWKLFSRWAFFSLSSDRSYDTAQRN